MKLRKTEVKRDGEWQVIEFEAVRRGDFFRLFEPDGQPVFDDFGRSEFVAASDAMPSPPDGNVAVRVES